MKGDLIKWIFSFVLLGCTIGWGVFSVNTVSQIMAEPTGADVLAAAGVGGLTAAFITWDALVIQYWFRKKTPAGGGEK